MCARGEEVASTQRSAQKAQGPPRRQARWSPSTAAQAEGASTGEAAGAGGATRAPAVAGAKSGVERKRAKRGDALGRGATPTRDTQKRGFRMIGLGASPAATMDHLRARGEAVDWPLSFITTPLTPPYDAFVRWQ